MKARLKAILDSKATWTTIGIFAGSLLGQKASMIVAGLGEFIMAIL